MDAYTTRCRDRLSELENGGAGVAIMNTPKYEARNPEFAAISRDGFSRHGLMTHLGVEMVTVEPGFVELGVDHRPELTQQHGLFHGGVMGAMADTACGYAAFSLTDVGSTVLTWSTK